MLEPHLQDCGRSLTDWLIIDVPKKKQIATKEKKNWKQYINYKGHGWMTKKYFDDRISPSLTKVCKWAIDKITRFDPYSGITQNQSESMNKLLK